MKHPQNLNLKYVCLLLFFLIITACSIQNAGKTEQTARPEPVLTAPAPPAPTPPPMAEDIPKSTKQSASAKTSKNSYKITSSGAKIGTKKNTTINTIPSKEKTAHTKINKETVNIIRHPTLEAPDEVKIAQTFAVQVSLTEDLITPEVKIKSINPELVRTTEDGQLSLKLPEQNQWELDVILSAPGFKYLNSNTSKIILPQQGDSLPAVFKLSAKSISKPQKNSKLFITLWHKGVYLAKIMREIEIINPTLADNENLINSEVKTQKEESVSSSNQKSKTLHVKTENLDLKFDLTAADLTVFVLESLDPERPYENQIIINSPYLQPRSQTYYSVPELKKWINKKYDLFTRHSSRVSIPKGLTMKDKTIPLMTGFGRELYQKFAPALFKEAYWTLKDKLGDKFQSIQIFTNNPHLPWELMKPSRTDGSDEQDFISLQHRVGRWHISQNHLQMDRPPQSVSASKVSVIAPQYQDSEELQGQTEELATLKKLSGYQKIPADFKGVKNFFTNLPSGIIHFAGHGLVKEEQGIQEYAILLNDSELNLATWKGLITNKPNTHPFFFFNACKIGQSQRIANVINGWAPAVLDTGASGYVGALWPVSDDGATDFGIHFYAMLNHHLKIGSVTVSEALSETRKLFFQSGDPSYLSYIFYGDPNLKFVKK